MLKSHDLRGFVNSIHSWEKLSIENRNKFFGEILIESIDALIISAKDLASWFKVPRSIISEWIRNMSFPEPNIQQEIIRFLENQTLSLIELLEKSQANNIK